MLVVRSGKVVFEEYAGMDPATRKVDASPDL
jgi:hypothetical protein